MTARGAWLCLVLAAAACAAGPQRVERRSAALARAVRRGDVDAARAMMLPSTVAGADLATLTAPASRRAWAKRLRRTDEVHLSATVMLAPGLPARVVRGPRGWAFADDPTDVYAQGTPEQAVAALVWATRRGRWDVLVRLAPRRYRVGLSASQLEAAWTEGEGAAELRRARDRVAEHLGEPIPHDDHEGRLDLGGGHVLRLEREAGAWVIVDF